MSCRLVKPLISAYLDHQLTETQARLVEEHLSHCVPCAQEYQAVRAVKYAVRSLSARAPSDIATYRISERLSDEIDRESGQYDLSQFVPPPYPTRRLFSAMVFSCLCIFTVAAPFSPATMERYHSWRLSALPLSKNPFEAPMLARSNDISAIDPFAYNSVARRTRSATFVVYGTRPRVRQRQIIMWGAPYNRPFDSGSQRSFNSDASLASFTVP